MRVSHVKLAAQSLIDVCCPYILSAYKKRQSSGYDFNLLRVVNHSVRTYLVHCTVVEVAVSGVVKRKSFRQGKILFRVFCCFLILTCGRSNIKHFWGNWENLLCSLTFQREYVLIQIGTYFEPPLSPYWPVCIAHVKVVRASAVRHATHILHTFYTLIYIHYRGCQIDDFLFHSGLEFCEFDVQNGFISMRPI